MRGARQDQLPAGPQGGSNCGSHFPRERGVLHRGGVEGDKGERRGGKLTYSVIALDNPIVVGFWRQIECLQRHRDDR